MSNILFNNALNRVPQKTPPIWFMRQAGRYHSHYQNLKEDLPANNTGSQGAIAGFSAASTGPVAGTSPKLFSRNDSLLDQDYQTPGQSGDAEWRFSNVYPVQRLTDADVDSMVDASKEYINKVDNANNSNSCLLYTSPSPRD